MNDVIIWQCGNCKKKKKRGKTFRIPSETMLQYSVFDRKCQIYLLKDVNCCTDNFLNSVDIRRHVSQSLGEWLYLVHCHKCQLRGWCSSFFLKWIFDALKFSLFDQNVQDKHKNSENDSAMVCSTWKQIIREDIIGLVTWMKRITEMMSLTCTGSAMVGIFNKGLLRINSC